MKNKNNMSHKEIMEKRHHKRKKKEKCSIQERKKELLIEYMKLNKVDETTDHKKVSQMIMEEIEEIKEKGRMNDNSYLHIMDQLMALHSGKEMGREMERVREMEMGREMERDIINIEIYDNNVRNPTYNIFRNINLMNSRINHILEIANNMDR